MIEVEQVSKRYGRAAVPALDQVTLSVGTGVFGLLGPNGSGKSTLMQILATLMPPSSGRAAVAGYDVQRERAQVRGVLGYLPQDFGFYPQLTALETLDYFALLSGLGKERSARITEVLATVGLGDVARNRVSTFSGGMKQRLGIAQALLTRPAVLIVDEPTVGLDPAERARFRTLLVELGTHSAIVLSTHIVADVASTCSDVAVLQRGRLAFQGSLQELAAQAKDRVWTAVIPQRALGDIQKSCVIAATTAVADGLEIRGVGTPPLSFSVHSTEPTIEDGYLALVGAS